MYIPRHAYVLSVTSGIAAIAYGLFYLKRKRQQRAEPAYLVAQNAASGADVTAPADIDKKIASIIDHTLLAPSATEQDIVRICKEALSYGFASVCVNSCWVPLVARELAGSKVKVCCVVGFPLGAALSSAKAFEAAAAVRAGAQEIDMVINVGWLKAGRNDEVREDIAAVVRAARSERKDAVVKVILETCLLTDEEKERACKLAVEAGADFVKTSTGFSKSGATVEDVRLMRKAVGPNVGVKASGGIRDKAAAQAMVEAGATRIGASSGMAIVQGGSGNSAY